MSGAERGDRSLDRGLLPDALLGNDFVEPLLQVYRFMRMQQVRSGFEWDIFAGFCLYGILAAFYAPFRCVFQGAVLV
jgi:hypothetical protein